MTFNKVNIYTKKQNIKIKSFLIAVAVLFLFILFFNIFQEQIRNIFYFISSPIATIFQQGGNNTSTFFESFLKIKDLKNENDDLKKENQKLLSEIYFLQESIGEHLELKEVLKNVQSENFKIVSAKTIGLDVFNDFILMDKGSDDGISENMPVISSQKILYGKVFKVYKNFSQVMLISNKNSVLDVKIISGNDYVEVPIYGAVKGRGNLSIYLDLVPFDAEIKEGDTLVTSALDGVFPKGFLIGKILIKNKNDLKPFQMAEIQSFFNIKNIENLFVITNYMKK